jgi:large subunit ribosomal protein L3
MGKKMPTTVGLLGRKIGMTRVYDEFGKIVPVTVIEAGPCKILQKKTVQKEGYNAIQLGFAEKKLSRVNKPLAGHFKRSGGECFYHIKEFRIEDPSAWELGQEVRANMLLKVGDKIDVTGHSKGCGFQGVVKRHGFRGGRDTHGSMFHRAPGSIGASAWPSRVIKGKKLPGHMGTNQVTQKNLIVIDIRDDENLILVRGAVPGAENGILQIFTRR